MLGRGPRDWRQYVEIRAPAVAEMLDVISLGDRYIVSLGAHNTHTIMLMDRCSPEPLTVEKCLNCCSLLAYAIDAAVVPAPGRTALDAASTRAFSRTLKGTMFRSAADYGEKLGELADLADVHLQAGLQLPQLVFRRVVFRLPRQGYWVYYPWPESDAIFRALSAYWLGTLSITAPSRILNFWRATEAVVPRREREALFSQLAEGKIAPVWTEATRIPTSRHRPRRLDSTRPLRRLALRRRDELVARFGSDSEALNFIVGVGRGKAAHADQQSLEFDFAHELGDQLRDAELLRYMARVAIESRWRSAIAR